jgi:hypothetical protein
VELVVVIGPEIDGITLAAALGEAQNIDEEVETRLRLVGEELDMAKMRDVKTGITGHLVNLATRSSAIGLPVDVDGPVRGGTSPILIVC